MRKFYIFLGIVAVIAAFAVAALIAIPQLGSEATQPRSGTVITEAEEVNTRALAFVQPGYRDDYGNTRIAGYVDNLGDKDLIVTELSIELRDSEGNRTAVLEHTVNSVPAGQRKWFDIDAGTWTGPQDPAVTVTSIEVAQ
jgi:hypothetical protein